MNINEAIRLVLELAEESVLDFNEVRNEPQLYAEMIRQQGAIDQVRAFLFERVGA